MALDTWLIYLVAAIGLSLSPGPNGLLALTHGALHGRRKTLWTIFGGSVGFVAVIALSMFGIGALLQTSLVWLTVLKWVGGAYLVWLGVQVWRSPPIGVELQATGSVRGGGSLFRQGLLSAATNPKGILFFAAFLPQFIDPASPNKGLGMLFLGVVFTFNGTLWNLFVAWSSATVSSRFKASPVIATWLNRACGGLFLYFSLKLVRSNA